MMGTEKVTSQSLSSAITQVINNKQIAGAANRMSARVAKEDGVGNAVRFIDTMAATFTYPWPTKQG